MRTRRQRMSTSCLAAGAGLCLLGAGFSGTSFAADGGASGTGSPIEHLVVIFQENVSFDHYFATYPIALNPKGEPAFHAADDTPSVNGLGTLMNGQPEGVLLTHNPNASNPANGSNAINPFRLDRSQASTCDQDHAYGDEQKAFDQGLIDLFPASVGAGDRDFLRSHIRLGQGQGPRAGVFRRQHRYGPVELRAEFRDER